MDIKQRNLSLDVFRGMTICFMIIVNTPGNWECVYAPLNHATWHGFTPTDLVFPSFLFAVGSALYFSLKNVHLSNNSLLPKIIKRTAILFLIGYLMYWFPFFRATDSGYEFKPFHDTRVMGVLQRIALCYGLASILILKCSARTLSMVSILILLLYWALMAWGGDYAMTTNLAHKLDVLILGESHMYHGEGVAFEPEGFLSTLPSIVNVLAGYLVTRYLLVDGVTKNKLMYIALGGLGLLVLSWAWHGWFPINKKLWTSSFVLQTVGWDMIILALLSYLIEILGIRMGTRFFYTAGRNPLAIYLFSEVLAILMGFVKTGPDSTLYGDIFKAGFQWMGCHIGSFVFALVIMMICWAFGWILDKKQIYWRI